MTTGEDLAAALADLGRASRHQLAEQWAGYFGAPPPPRTSRALLLRAVAYKMQERALGGLSAGTRRRLCGPEPRPVRHRRTLRPGTVLVRQWHGVGRSDQDRGVLIAASAIARCRSRPPDHRHPLVRASCKRRHDGGAVMTLRCAMASPLLPPPHGGAPTLREAVLTREVRLRIRKRRGVEMRLVIEGPSAGSGSERCW